MHTSSRFSLPLAAVLAALVALLAALGCESAATVGDSGTARDGVVSDRVVGDGPVVPDGGPTDGVLPPDGQPPRPDGLPPRPDFRPPRPDGLPPRPDRPLRPDGLPPRPDGLPPRPDRPERPDGLPPRPDGPRPDRPFRPDGLPPRPDGGLPPAAKTINAASLAQFANLADEALTKMRQGYIFFGHQSVGQNILSGLDTLGNQDARYRLAIEYVSGGGDYTGPMLGHAGVEENGDPWRKIDSFQSFIVGGIGDKVQTAFFKFCYVDFGPDTDVNGLFAKYKTAIAALRQAYPNVVFAHVTVPLETTGPEYNAKRHAFSNLLRQEYGGKDFILDLADIESDGTRCKAGGSPKLCDGYSSDGGHLNDTGAERVAKGMIMMLARMLSGPVLP